MKESAQKFISRFDESTKKVRLYDKALRDEEVIDNFLLAIQERYENIVTQYNSNPDKYDLTVLQAELLSKEAQQVEINERSVDTGDKTAAMATRAPEKEACRWCGKIGHHYKACQNPKWICYNCLSLTDTHQSWNCPYERSNNARPPRGPPAQPQQRPVPLMSVPATIRPSFGPRPPVQFPKRRGKGPATNPSFMRPMATAKKTLFKRVAVPKSKQRPEANLAEDNEYEYAYIPYEEESVENGSQQQNLDKCALLTGNGNFNSVIIPFVGDSGANEHLTNNLNLLKSVREVPRPIRIRCANRNSTSDLIITHVGDLYVKGPAGEALRLENVLYSADLTKNLFSIRKIVNGGAMVILDDCEIKIYSKKDGHLITSGKYDGNFWWLNFEPCDDDKQKDKLIFSLHIMLGILLKTVRVIIKMVVMKVMLKTVGVLLKQ